MSTERWTPPDRVVAIVRSSDADLMHRVAAAIIGAGITCVEFSLSSRAAFDALTMTRDSHPDATLGIGTVTRTNEAADAVAVGADFILTPVFVKEVLDASIGHGLPIVVGAFSPTEIWDAWRAGADAVKVFPASLGGPEYIRAVRAPLPELRLVPTGGVEVDDTVEYLDAGAIAVGIGSPLTGSGDLDGITARAASLAAALERWST